MHMLVGDSTQLSERRGPSTQCTLKLTLGGDAVGFGNSHRMSISGNVTLSEPLRYTPSDVQAL